MYPVVFTLESIIIIFLNCIAQVYFMLIADMQDAGSHMQRDAVITIVFFFCIAYS